MWSLNHVIYVTSFDLFSLSHSTLGAMIVKYQSNTDFLTQRILLRDCCFSCNHIPLFGIIQIEQVIDMIQINETKYKCTTHVLR